MPDAHTEVPAEPETTAWQLAAADVGSNVVMLALAVGVLWRWGTGLVTKLLAASTDERKAADVRVAAERAAADARVERLAGTQAQAIDLVSAGLHRVEQAIVKSDANNTAAINALAASIDRHDARLDKHEARINDHGERLVAIESSSTSGVRRVPRTVKD